MVNNIPTFVETVVPTRSYPLYDGVTDSLPEYSGRLH